MLHACAGRAPGLFGPMDADGRRQVAASLGRPICISVTTCAVLAVVATLSGFDALSQAGMVLLTKLAFISATALAVFIFLGVMIAGPFLGALLTLEALHKTVLGVIILGPLAFSQTTDSQGAAPKPASSGESAMLRSGVQVGLYGGGNLVQPADVIFKQPNGTDMVLKDVPFAGQSYRSPPFYGLRATYWTPAIPTLGVMLDFTHAKAIAERDSVVEQTGTRDGKPVPPREKVRGTFTKLEYSHGLNFLTINAVYRFDGWHRRIAPYIGAGVGIMIPHIELSHNGVRKDWTYRYGYTGPGAQALAGIEWRVFPRERFSAFTEYKVGYASNHSDLDEGGTVENQLFVQQAILGFSAYLGRGATSTK